MLKVLVASFLVSSLGVDEVSPAESFYETPNHPGQVPNLDGFSECTPWWIPGVDPIFFPIGDYHVPFYMVAVPKGDAMEGEEPTVCGRMIRVRRSGTSNQYSYGRINGFTKGSSKDSSYSVSPPDIVCSSLCESASCCSFADFVTEFSTLPQYPVFHLYLNVSEDIPPPASITCAGSVWDKERVDNTTRPEGDHGDGGDGDSVGQPAYAVATELDGFFWGDDETGISPFSRVMAVSASCDAVFRLTREGSSAAPKHVKIRAYIPMRTGNGMYEIIVPTKIKQHFCPTTDPDTMDRIETECHIVSERLERGNPRPGTIGYSYIPRDGDITNDPIQNVNPCSEFDWTGAVNEPSFGGNGLDWRKPGYAVAARGNENLPESELVMGCDALYKVTSIHQRYEERFIRIAGFEAEGVTKMDFIMLSEPLCSHLCRDTCVFSVCNGLEISQYIPRSYPEDNKVYDIYEPAQDKAPGESATCPNAQWVGALAVGGTGESEWKNYAFVVAISVPPIGWIPSDAWAAKSPVIRMEPQEACDKILVATTDVNPDTVLYLQVAGFEHDNVWGGSQMYAINMSPYHCEKLCGRACVTNEGELHICDIKLEDYVEDVGTPRDGEVTTELISWVAANCNEMNCAWDLASNNEDNIGCGTEEKPCPARIRGSLTNNPLHHQCGSVWKIRSASLKNYEMHVVAVSRISEATIPGFDVSHYGWHQICPAKCDGWNRCLVECMDDETVPEPAGPQCACEEVGEMDEVCGENCVECIADVGGSVLQRSTSGHVMHVSHRSDVPRVAAGSFAALSTACAAAMVF